MRVDFRETGEIKLCRLSAALTPCGNSSVEQKGRPAVWAQTSQQNAPEAGLKKNRLKRADESSSAPSPQSLLVFTMHIHRNLLRVAPHNLNAWDRLNQNQ